MWNGAKVLITGGTGMVAKSIRTRLEEKYSVEIFMPNRVELDLEDKKAVESYFKASKPKYVFHLAGKVHGLGGNLMFPMDLLSSNVCINDSVLTACANDSVEKVFFAGTVASYGYPFLSLPLNEKDIFDGEPHDGEFGYASAKRLAYSYLKLLNEKYGKKYIYGVYTNLYGPHDRFNSQSGHVIPSLIEKMYRALKSDSIFEVWGRPDVTRDFLYVDDAARAAISLMENYEGIYNIGSGVESSMGEVVDSIVKLSGFQGDVIWNSTRPTGIPRRYSSIEKLNTTGFVAKHDLLTGLSDTWNWYCNAILNNESIRK